MGDTHPNSVAAVVNLDLVAEEEEANSDEKINVTMKEVLPSLPSQKSNQRWLLGDDTVGIRLDITLSKALGGDPTTIPITETNSFYPFLVYRIYLIKKVYYNILFPLFSLLTLSLRFIGEKIPSPSTHYYSIFL